ncbi:protein of unknown function [Agrobacterium pusense]|uniref:Uncharacterized protein n=1 Tax=Agrobacterium pusense TaxID=648995 RepID=U4QDH5_9HYPH|nr:protein of unknown function [Agrobacterium pusense]
MREALIQIRADSEASLDEAFDRATSAMRSGNPSDPVAVFTFSSPAQLFSVITPKRWELIEHLQKIGPSRYADLPDPSNVTSSVCTRTCPRCPTGVSSNKPKTERFTYPTT